MATVEISAPIDMHHIESWYGTVQYTSSTEIIIESWPLQAIYRGNFTYDSNGAVYGTLTGFEEIYNNNTIFKVYDTSYSAIYAYNLIQSGNSQTLVQNIAGGDDTFKIGANITIPGNRIIDGFGGFDTLIEPYSYHQYHISRSGNATYISGASDTDILYNIERVVFSDGSYDPANGIFTASDSHTRGDFTGDETSDVLFSNTGGQFALWTIRNGVATASAGLGAMSGGWSLAGVGDFNGDGSTDLLFRYVDGTVASWEIQNGHVVAARAVGTTTGDWAVIGTGDLNADHTDDVVFRGKSGEIAQWQVHDGRATAASVVGVTTNDWDVVAIGRLSSVADCQMLFINGDGTVADWDVVNGRATAAHAIGQTSAYWSVIGIGDVTGDGQNDILFRGRAGEIATWVMQNGQVTGAHSIGQTTADWQVAGIGDYNGDGVSDILFRNINGAMAAWEMRDGQVAHATNMGVVTSDWQTAPVDTGIALHI